MLPMFIRQSFVLFVFAWLLPSCSQNPQSVRWPADLPPKAIFEASYQSDAANQQHQSESDYLTWVRRFFYGTPLQPKGWLEMSADLQSHVADDQKDYLSGLVTNLGVKIASEWAKDNKTRRLNTKNMIVWGGALRESIVANNVVALVESIDQDVDGLLAGSTSQEEINSERYFEMEYDEFF